MLKRRGFTLIEVLVTLVILMFGLLGIAGLMAKGQRAAFEAFQRQQALSLAGELAERLLGNRSQAAAYVAAAPTTTPVGSSYGLYYGDLLKNNITNCATAYCTSLELQQDHMAMWEGMLLGYSERLAVGNTLIAGVVNANGCVEQIGITSATCPAPPANTGNMFQRRIRISVAWQGNDDTGVPTSSTCGAGLYSTTASRRVVSIDVNVLEQCP